MGGWKTTKQIVVVHGQITKCPLVAEGNIEQPQMINLCALIKVLSSKAVLDQGVETPIKLQHWLSKANGGQWVRKKAALLVLKAAIAEGKLCTSTITPRRGRKRPEKKNQQYCTEAQSPNHLLVTPIHSKWYHFPGWMVKHTQDKQGSFCLVNVGFPLFWRKKPCFKRARCIFEGALIRYFQNTPNARVSCLRAQSIDLYSIRIPANIYPVAHTHHNIDVHE